MYTKPCYRKTCLPQGDSCTVNGFHRYVLTSKEHGDPKTLGLHLCDGWGFLVGLHHSPVPSATLHLFFFVFTSHCCSWLLSPIPIAHETVLYPRDAISKKDEYVGSHSTSYDFSLFPPCLVNQLPLLTPRTTPCCLILLACLPKITYTNTHVSSFKKL